VSQTSPKIADKHQYVKSHRERRFFRQLGYEFRNKVAKQAQLALRERPGVRFYARVRLWTQNCAGAKKPIALTLKACDRDPNEISERPSQSKPSDLDRFRNAYPLALHFSSAVANKLRHSVRLFTGNRVKPWEDLHDILDDEVMSCWGLAVETRSVQAKSLKLCKGSNYSLDHRTQRVRCITNKFPMCCFAPREMKAHRQLLAAPDGLISMLCNRVIRFSGAMRRVVQTASEFQPYYEDWMIGPNGTTLLLLRDVVL